MPRNSGTLVGAEVRPVDTADIYPVAYQSEIKGGYHSVQTIDDRNAIHEPRREFGMLCYVIEENKTYQLLDTGDGNLNDNLKWREKQEGTPQGLNDVLGVSNVAETNLIIAPGVELTIGDAESGRKGMIVYTTDDETLIIRNNTPTDNPLGAPVIIGGDISLSTAKTTAPALDDYSSRVPNTMWVKDLLDDKDLVETVTGNNVDNSDPKNPKLIYPVKDNRNFQIYGSVQGFNSLGYSLRYFTDMWRSINLKPVVPNLTSAITEILKSGDDLFMVANSTSSTNESNPVKLINMNKPGIVSNELTYPSIQSRDLALKVRTHGSDIHRGYVYISTRPEVGSSIPTQIVKVNPKNLNDVKILEIPNTRATDIIGYKDNVYIYAANPTQTKMSFIKIDQDLKGYSTLFEWEREMTGTFKAPQAVPFIIYRDEIYTLHAVVDSTTTKKNITVDVYNFKGEKVRTANLQINPNNENRQFYYNPHWMTVINGKLIITPTGTGLATPPAVNSWEILRIDCETLVLEEAFNLPNACTDDNFADDEGYIYTNGEGSNYDNTALGKIYYLNFANTYQPLVTPWTSTATVNGKIFVDKESQLISTSKLKNTGENGTDKYATESLVATKQNTLVSGSNIKTVNGQSLLGSGDITISGGGGTGTVTNVSGTSGQINVANPTTTPVISIDPAYQPAQATETTRGTSAIATASETTTGTDNTKYITPLRLKGVTDTKQNTISGTGYTYFNGTTIAWVTGSSNTLTQGNGNTVQKSQVVFTDASLPSVNVVSGAFAAGDSLQVLMNKINFNIPVRGISTQNGVGGSTKQYVIPHNLGVTPSHANAIPQNTASAGIESITWNASNIIINYTVAPQSGTANLSWGWIAFR